MPQLAPVNWLFLFILFWFVVTLGATLIWWSFKSNYSIPSSTSTQSIPRTNLWSW
uniref:ATP synthase subunit 8 n=1 Tax=Steromphala umbilicaris TaxID=2072697 RepID=A0A240F5J8_9VEST|nr:ATP synthase subunit 8 [Steromphala umbilicaris]AQD17688.1 ATP synthase subunit 8 [Steromphala umbilicaris]AQD17701.1 ATP synthase subunit 8 [Steromphala umbilicaris]